MSDYAIETHDLRRSFGANEAVAGVDLAVRPGEIYGFLGPNGAGKSTTVRILCTLLSPTGGTARVAGFDVATQTTDVRLRIGVALQEAALDDKQTGVEVLRLQGRLYGLSRSEVDSRLRDLRGLIDIGDALDARVSSYSGGMKRRLDLAAALMHDPKVLFLDEPTTGLDPVSRSRVWEEVRRLNTDLGMTIFLTTQYLEEADVLAGRLAVIDKGKIVAEGTPSELKKSVGTDLVVADVDGNAAAAAEQLRGLEGVDRVEQHDQEVTVAAADGARMVSRVAVALSEAGVSVRTLTLRTPTLDDVFLDLTGNRLAVEENA